MEYKVSRYKIVADADAFPRWELDGVTLWAVSMPLLSLFDVIHHKQQNDLALQQLLSQVQ